MNNKSYRSLMWKASPIGRRSTIAYKVPSAKLMHCFLNITSTCGWHLSSTGLQSHVKLNFQKHPDSQSTRGQ